MGVASELSADSKLHGYDVSAESFLPPHQLPHNVSMAVLDAKQPPPSHLHSVYDVVCIRFINAALMPDDWRHVARHLMLLLKPGGFLQWIEGDLLQLAQPLRGVPEASIAALVSMPSCKLLAKLGC